MQVDRLKGMLKWKHAKLFSGKISGAATAANPFLQCKPFVKVQEVDVINIWNKCVKMCKIRMSRRALTANRILV